MEDVEIPVILNPFARSQRSRGWLAKIRTLAENVRVYETTGPGHARELARDFAVAGAPAVVVAGGDGSINEVANGLAEGGLDHGAVLGILPIGTMNVFAVELGLPPAWRLERCWDVIAAGKHREIDLWTAGDRRFVQLAGVGLDAEVIKETTWDKKKAFGPLSYVMSAAQLIMREAASVVAIPENGEPVRGAIVLIGNGQRYAGPFRIFRDASNSDGLLDVIVLRNQGFFELIEFVKAAGLTGYHGSRDIEYFQTPSLRVETVDGPPASVEADGDLIGETPVEFSLAPHPLRVFAP